MRTLDVLALNSGSSSLKLGLYRVDATTTRELAAETVSVSGPEAAVEAIERLLARPGMPPPAAIGHRIVHGGPRLRRHCRIDDAVVEQLDAATPFAPLHLPASLALVRFTGSRFAELPQVACFDTAFHADLPDLARTLPIAKSWRDDGIERYGFHGLSLESIVHDLGTDCPARVVVAHLGNGSSVTALRSGRSVDTTMGLTPTGGVVMGTRSGDLDPGVLLHLMRERHFDSAMFEALVDHESGMAGISGIAGDMRRLREAASSDPDARLAIAMFCASVRKAIAAMITVLDGMDLLVFTGGIGENDAATRAAICDGLGWIGVVLDDTRNRAGRGPIGDARSRSAIRVVPTREDEQIARHAWELLG